MFDRGLNMFLFSHMSKTYLQISTYPTAQKRKFSIKDFFTKCDQILHKSFLRIWSHLLKKYLMENFIFCAVPSEDTVGTVSTSQWGNTCSDIVDQEYLELCQT